MLAPLTVAGTSGGACRGTVLQSCTVPGVLMSHALLSLSLPLPADIISTVEFNHTGELLATGDKGGRVVIFQREPEVRGAWWGRGYT